jgi:hypothetical protein
VPGYDAKYVTFGGGEGEKVDNAEDYQAESIQGHVGPPGRRLMYCGA